MFRRQEVTTLIKRCNDFGAGGVSVAIGELTDGLDINLDKVPKKYEASTERNWPFLNLRNEWLSSLPRKMSINS